MHCYLHIFLILIAVSFPYAYAADPAERTKDNPNDNSIPYYTSFTPGIVLPPTAEKHLLSSMGFVKVVAIHKLVYDRRQHSFDYLGIDGEYEMPPGGFEGVYYHTFILRKRAKDRDWSQAVIFRSETVSLAGLFDLNDKDFQKALIEARKVVEKAEQAGADQPATKPADKPQVKDQPSTPTSKDLPR